MRSQLTALAKDFRVDRAHHCFVNIVMFTIGRLVFGKHSFAYGRHAIFHSSDSALILCSVEVRRNYSIKYLHHVALKFLVMIIDGLLDSLFLTQWFAIAR